TNWNAATSSKPWTASAMTRCARRNCSALTFRLFTVNLNATGETNSQSHTKNHEGQKMSFFVALRVASWKKFRRYQSGRFVEEDHARADQRFGQNRPGRVCPKTHPP